MAYAYDYERLPTSIDEEIDRNTNNSVRANEERKNRGRDKARSGHRSKYGHFQDGFGGSRSRSKSGRKDGSVDSNESSISLLNALNESSNADNSSSGSSSSSPDGNKSNSSSSGSGSGSGGSGSSGSGSGSGSSGSGSSGSSSSGSSGSSKKKERKSKKKRTWFEKIMKSSPDENKLLKAVLWFPMGLAVSALLYYLVWRKMDLEPTTKLLLGGCLALGISLTFALSVSMRCILCLVLPTFLGKAGRGYIAAFAVIYLISGPVSNIVDNGKEVVRSLSCTSELLANHSKEKWKLRLSPVEGAVGDITKDGFLIERISKRIRKAFTPIKKELRKNREEEEEMEKQIEDVEKLQKSHENTVEKVEKEHAKDKESKTKAEKVEKEWEKKLELRCQDTYSKGVVRCREKMGELESKCMDALSLIGHLMCLPLKITIFCQIIKLLPGAIGMDCKSMDVIPPGFGQTFTDADDVIDDMDQGMNVKMQYKMVGADNPELDYTPALELRQAALHEVDKKTQVLSTFMTLVTSILAFTFLRVFKAAYEYNKQYTGELTFDNTYITSYFRHIDARRRKQGKKTLLPLKKKERVDTISPTTVGLTKREKKTVSKGVGLLVFRVIITSIIVYMDSLVYQILDIISRNGRVEYHQEGEHTVDIKVYGKGFMSALVHSFLTKFNSKHSLNKVTTNQECLPVPSKTDGLVLGFLYGAYVMVYIFMYFQAYGLRMRRPIAAFFYRKREKTRILYLYNKMYRTRIGYLDHMRKRIKKQIKEREFKVKVGLLASLQNTFPRLCGCLRYLKKPKRSCIICEDSENKEFYHCPTQGCGISYCKDCWRDLKRKCLACKMRDEDDSDDDEDESSSDNAADDDADDTDSD